MVKMGTIKKIKKIRSDLSEGSMRWGSPVSIQIRPDQANFYGV